VTTSNQKALRLLWDLGSVFGMQSLGPLVQKWVVRVLISESEDLGLAQVRNVWIRIDRDHNNHLFDRLGRTKVSLRTSTASIEVSVALGTPLE
jgi:hypothetical protein